MHSIVKHTSIWFRRWYYERSLERYIRRQEMFDKRWNEKYRR
jgi:hypothetical protein